MNTKHYIDELKRQITDAHDFPFEMVTYAQADKVFHDYVALKYYDGEGELGDDLYIITMHSANTYTVTVWGEFDYDESEYNPKYIYLCDRQFWELDDLLIMLAIDEACCPANDSVRLIVHNNSVLETVLCSEPFFFNIHVTDNGVEFTTDGIDMSATVDDHSITAKAFVGDNALEVKSFNCKDDEVIKMLLSLRESCNQITFHTETMKLFRE